MKKCFFFFSVFIGPDLELFELLAHFSRRNKNLRASSCLLDKISPPFFFKFIIIFKYLASLLLNRLSKYLYILIPLLCCSYSFSCQIQISQPILCISKINSNSTFVLYFFYGKSKFHSLY